jgi:hypothetical protein
MDSFLLASQRLTRSGQGETDYNISSSFSKLCQASRLCRLVWPDTTPSIRLYFSRAWSRFSLTRGDPSSPFSGAAKALQRPATHNRQPRSRPNNTTNNRTKQQQQLASMPPYRPSNPNAGNHQKFRWGPQGQIAMQASSFGHDKVKIARLHAVIVNMTGGPGQYASNGMPSAPDPYSDVSLLSSARPRPFYCNVMRANPEYTPYQKNASSPNGTGGNPSIGVQVTFTRPRSKKFNPYITFVHLVPPLSTLSPNSLPPPNSQAIKDRPVLPHMLPIKRAH